MTEPHPPIPPNCPQFRNTGLHQHGPWLFDAVDWASSVYVHKSDEVRPIIAAVAEVAWLKAAHSLDRRWPAALARSRYESRCRLSDSRSNFFSVVQSYYQARENALKWREWGEQGETP